MFSPPAINTRPSDRRVAVWPRRSVAIAETGLSGSALTAEFSAGLNLLSATAFVSGADALLPKTAAARVNIGPKTFAEDEVAASVIAAIDTRASNASKRTKLRLLRIVLMEKRSEEIE